VSHDPCPKCVARPEPGTLFSLYHCTENGTCPKRAAAVRPIYVASRASIPERPGMWRVLRDAHHWPINSTWIDEAGPGETADFGELWQRILAEITASCGVLLYAEPGDFPLKGALIEVGIALGLGKRVAVVLPRVTLDADSRPVGSWIWHPKARICDTVEEAREHLQRIDAFVAKHLPGAAS
jgi:hypothetical protein